MRSYYQQAIDDVNGMRQKLNSLGDAAFYHEAFGDLLSALAYWRLNDPTRARQSLQEAKSVMEAKFPKPGRDDIQQWRDWIYCQALRVEAESLMVADR